MTFEIGLEVVRVLTSETVYGLISESVRVGIVSMVVWLVYDTWLRIISNNVLMGIYVI